MTETRPENGATLDMKAKVGVSGSSSKLRPTAKEFVFNTAAPVWIPSAVATPPPIPRTSQLKLSAKPFVPSFTAPVFVPASMQAPPKSTQSVETVMSTTTTNLVKKNEVTTTLSDSVSTPATSAASSNASEPEVDDIKDDAKPEIQVEATEREEKQKHDINVEFEDNGTTKEPKTERETQEIVTEQVMIGERILYTIQQLLDMEPEIELCIMPESVKESCIAADESTKALSASASDFLSRDVRRTDSSRSLSRQCSSSSGEGRGRRERGSSRGVRAGRGDRSHHETAPALEDCAPLDINEETRWKPSHAKSRLDEPVETVEASLKEAKSILNKLSIEKFEKLSDQLIEVAVRGLDVLKGVIEMVIAKAQMEWHFSTMYAELCAKIAQTAMPAITLEEGEVVTNTHKLFRKLLLQQCQKEFEAKPEIEGLDDMAEAERLEKELILKRASLGHIRFVGELFKQRMLSSRIMHECISILFGDIAAPDEESLECLCNLLSTIGQTLEANAKEQAELEHISGYYTTIRKLSGQSKLLCTRVRFMLQDLLDLRKNRWVARRKESKAMTIAEVHAEVAREAKEKERSSTKSGSHIRLQRSHSMNSTGSINSNDRRRSSGGGGASAWKARASATSTPLSSNSNSNGVASVDADGWETVTGGPRSKGMKHRSNSDRFPAPSSGGLLRHPSNSRLTNSNTFASLSGNDIGRKERSRSNSSSSMRVSRGREDIGRPPTPFSAKSSCGESLRPKKTSQVTSVSPMTAEAFEKKVKAILDEYVELEDLEEAYTSLTELNAATHYNLIPNKVLNIGLERGEKEREAVASFLAGLYDRKIVTSAALESALQNVLEFTEEIEIDIPKTLPYLSEMVAPSVVSGCLTIPQLVAMTDHLRYNGKAAKLIGSTLASVVLCEDEAKVLELLAVESIDFMALLAETNRNEEAVREFYRDYSLGFLL
ncbi:eukaryotic translation initiation [Plasmopara halstedii]|uniref:Eukaryotic translation initiation n=1 Tax=Plasmopara halstedii TaxID=4781 RepID=A0A0P1AXA6_PLAHL|nr:eukaryotic translation initiation [Plasmopara halstedii]CEG47076.1 eukaryotic translation initiation [Plasmopara halstedii]|eukprot:XP_024583445.1 eukaryotic translation initiation [Plasmopara halstedii]